MNERIKHLQINNYKSIRQLNLDCSRINVFVGEPNIGKSNILEGLNLYYLSWLFNRNVRLKEFELEPIDIKEFFRVRKADNLFHFNDVTKEISIKQTGLSWDVFLSFDNAENNFIWGNKDGIHIPTRFNNDFKPINTSFYNGYIAPYKYKDDIQFHDNGNYMNTLMPPYGNNLGTVIRLENSMQYFVAELLKGRGLEMIIDEETNDISISSRKNEVLSVKLPYKAMADTFRRMLFYVAAIRYSGFHDIITLEEPEVHSFPSYISYLADEIIESKKQFFIVTHSPYLLSNLIENTPSDELSVFVCGYDTKDSQTIAKKLSGEDLSELLDYGVDIFFNLNKYLNDRVENRS